MSVTASGVVIIPRAKIPLKLSGSLIRLGLLHFFERERLLCATDRKYARRTIRQYTSGEAQRTSPFIGQVWFWLRFYIAVEAERMHTQRAKRRGRR